MVGGTPSTGSVEFKIIINEEFTVRFNTQSFIQSNPSPVDVFEENFVLGQLSLEQHSAASVPLSEFAKAPTTSKVTAAEQKETGGPLSALSESVGFLGSILEVGLPLLGALL
jgi:hypothetical protein